jgi:hypothetical protein
MGEPNGIDSLVGGWAIPKAYSGDMRQRLITEVESGFRLIVCRATVSKSIAMRHGIKAFMLRKALFALSIAVADPSGHERVRIAAVQPDL